MKPNPKALRRKPVKPRLTYDQVVTFVVKDLRRQAKRLGQPSLTYDLVRGYLDGLNDDIVQHPLF